MIKCLKTAMLCTILVAGAAAVAYAADPTPPQTQTKTPPQVATGNGIPYPSTQMPAPQGGSSTGIPSDQYHSAGNSETEQGSYYSKKGFGPKTH